MIPGMTSKLSESILAVAPVVTFHADIIRVTDVAAGTVLTNIVPATGGFGQVAFVINNSGGNITTVATGNIATAVTIPVNMSCPFVYSKVTGKWYPGPIS